MGKCDKEAQLTSFPKEMQRVTFSHSLQNESKGNFDVDSDSHLRLSTHFFQRVRNMVNNLIYLGVYLRLWWEVELVDGSFNEQD